MRLQQWKHWQKSISLSFFLKSTAIVLFLILSILIVSCGSSSNSQANLGNPVVTVTIHLGQTGGSPTPQFPAYACGGWATDTSPPYSPTGIVNVYAKFTHTDAQGNPEGVAGASGTAIILWPDGSTSNLAASTGTDGLAVFPVALKPIAINRIVLIQITFSKAGDPTCTIPQAAYFTAIIASPTPIASPSTTATVSPGPGGTGTPTATPGTPSPTPKPTKTPKPH